MAKFNVKNFILTALGKTGSLKKRLVMGAAGTFGVRIANIGLTFIISILFARLLGVSGFGVYTYTMTCANLLGIPATLGLETLLIREVATYQNKEAWGLMRGILRWANQIALAFSIGLVLVVTGIAWYFWKNANSQALLAFCIAMAFLPIASKRNLMRGALRGLHRVVIALVPEMLVVPIVQIVVTVCAYLLLKSGLTAPWVLGIYVFAGGISLVISIIFLDRNLPDSVREATPKYQVRRWLSSSLVFMCLESIYYLSPQIDLLMLGALKSLSVVGVYYPVNRGAQLILLIPMAVSTAIAPTIVQLYAQGNHLQLQKLITTCTRVVFVGSLLLSVGLIALSHFYLLLFGSEFTSGQNALIILCIGMVVSIATGSADILLNMTGYERYVTINAAVTTVFNAILNLLLIPTWGIEGAALATVISMTLASAVNAVFARKKLGIYATVLGGTCKII